MASEFAGGGTRTRPAERSLPLQSSGCARSAWRWRASTLRRLRPAAPQAPGRRAARRRRALASEQCAIIQSVVDDQRPNVTLVIIALKTADHKSRLLRVIAPLGALLPTGLDLKLDAEDVGRMGFVRCLPNGCVAETLIDDKLLQRMESAQTMTLVLFQTPEEGIGVPAPMAGFKDAFDKLP